MIERWKRRYQFLEDVVAGLAMIVGVGIMFLGVVARYIFNAPMSFVDEIAPIFFVWSTLVGYSIAMRKDEHIKMDALYEVIKAPQARRAIRIFGQVCGLLFCAFAIYYGANSMSMQYKMQRVTPILEFPVWITYTIVPLSGCVMSVRYVIELYQSIVGKEARDG